MKTRISNLNLLLIVGLLSLIPLVACTPSPTVALAAASTPAAGMAAPVPADDVVNVDESGYTAIDQTALSGALAQIAVGQLSNAEIEGILFMREEEKLARDVYLTFYEKWGLRIFQNIAASEATHMEAVKTLIDRYGLEDPAVQNIGVFTNPTLQELYNQLTADGSQSLADALRVGAAIEEIDILDLEERAAQTDKADIELVYKNLTKGSRNHLRAFTSILEKQTGQIYQPQHLDPAAYERIVSTPKETGGHGQGRGQRQNQRG